MKHLSKILLLGVLLWSGGLRAQSSSQLCAVVETTTGERMEYLLTDLPRIVYADAKVTLTTNKTTVDFNPEEIKKVYLGESTSDIQDQKMPDGTFRLQSDRIFLSGYTAGEEVSLYSTDGRQLLRKKVNADGRLTISLSQLPANLYIIKTNHQSIKITKK